MSKANNSVIEKLIFLLFFIHFIIDRIILD